MTPRVLAPESEVRRTLERLLANGPLTAWPHRPADAEVLRRMAALRFEPGRGYTEPEVNEILEAWLARFVAPFGIDHVTLRRELVDARLLARDSAGRLYRVDEARHREVAAEAAHGLDPAAVLAEVRAAREARKRRHGSG